MVTHKHITLTFAVTDKELRHMIKISDLLNSSEFRSIEIKINPDVEPEQKEAFKSLIGRFIRSLNSLKGI